MILPTAGNGLMAIQMVSERWSYLTVVAIKGTGSTAGIRVLANIHLETGQDTMENGWLVNTMEKVRLGGQMGPYIKGSGITVKKMDTAYSKALVA